MQYTYRRNENRLTDSPLTQLGDFAPVLHRSFSGGRGRSAPVARCTLVCQTRFANRASSPHPPRGVSAHSAAFVFVGYMNFHNCLHEWANLRIIRFRCHPVAHVHKLATSDGEQQTPISKYLSIKVVH